MSIMNKESMNILFSGVGGQGILLASEIMAHTLIKAGLDVKKSEVHGMAQRGGSVTAHLRYGQKVYSPLIEPGAAEILVAFEMLESLRYLPLLKKSANVVVNTQQISPPSVSLGNAEYPADILTQLTDRGFSVHPLDALAIAEELGELRTVNMVLVGALSKFVKVEDQLFLDVISERVKKQFVDVNIKAFQRGKAAIDADL